MSNTFVHVTLCFDTTNDPAELALTLGKLATSQVPDRLTSLHWTVLDDEDTDTVEEGTSP